MSLRDRLKGLKDRISSFAGALKRATAYAMDPTKPLMSKLFKPHDQHETQEAHSHQEAPVPSPSQSQKWDESIEEPAVDTQEQKQRIEVQDEYSHKSNLSVWEKSELVAERNAMIEERMPRVQARIKSVIGLTWRDYAGRLSPEAQEIFKQFVSEHLIDTSMKPQGRKNQGFHTLIDNYLKKFPHISGEEKELFKSASSYLGEKFNRIKGDEIDNWVIPETRGTTIDVKFVGDKKRFELVDRLFKASTPAENKQLSKVLHKSFADACKAAINEKEIAIDSAMQRYNKEPETASLEDMIAKDETHEQYDLDKIMKNDIDILKYLGEGLSKEPSKDGAQPLPIQEKKGRTP